MSEQDELPTSVEELLGRMEAARAAFYGCLEGLGEERLAAPITGGGWSAADHMAHIAVWMDGVREGLDGTDRWRAMGAEGPPGADGFDALNDRLRAPHAGKSPAEARALLDGAHERMAARLRGLTIEELRRPYRHYQPGEQRDDADAPYLNWIIGDTYGHYDEHRGWIEAALREKGWR